MAADPRMIQMMSYYRDAELHGANLLMRLLRLMDDPDAQVKLSLHLSDETHHAWLWTKRISDLGATPMRVQDGYQTRIGLRTVPRTLIDLLALTVVVEERAQARYEEHARRPNVDAATREILHEVTKDEKWHISWIRAKLLELTAQEGGGGEERANAAIEKYRQIDAEVYGELRAKEIAVFGEAVAPS